MQHVRGVLHRKETDCTIAYRQIARMAHVDTLSRGAVTAHDIGTHMLDILSIEETDQDSIATVQGGDEGVQRIKTIHRKT
ncbi:hypothetical protein KGM_212306 [Danaus plexippus plexippus]|uniref:Uncharacterized protein n=1 Tax=Danaus plexippus plexippus TaxID=278856 RepID=A0A212EYT4_DANPL|nr:hypothetical protein KGM_212306 [Danaus plexippus plexippus]